MKIQSLDGGLFLGSSTDSIPDDKVVSNRGLDANAINSFKSRLGSELLYDLVIHSIAYFDNAWYMGSGFSMYRAKTEIKDDLAGTDIFFTKCPPVAGVDDYLFFLDGTGLFKISPDIDVTNWGIVPPTSAPTVSATDITYTSIRSATYIWTQVGATNEYYCQLAATGDPSLPDPVAVRANSISLVLGSESIALEAGEYYYGDPGALGFDTIVVRLTDSSDPDSKAAGYVDYSTETNDIAAGTYQYLITYLNNDCGTRSNSNTTATSIDVEDFTKTDMILAGIPDGSLIDSQITHIEIWRTVANGAFFFYLDRVVAGTTTYTDDDSVTLSSTELPTDNYKPYDYFSDCLGPHNASMFWITRTEEKQRGRLYYSPIGRCEVMQGFIEVTNDTNVLQRIFRFQGQLGVIAQSGIFLIGGTNPYNPREVENCPGTNDPKSVVVTPSGVVYRAPDGLRIFNGSTSVMLGIGAVDKLFIGENGINLLAFGTTQAELRHDEYIISDGIQAIGYSFKYNRFRDLGVGFDALHYDPDTDKLACALNDQVVIFNQTNKYTDNEAAIPIIIEPKHFDLSLDVDTLVQFITFDIYTGSELLNAVLILDELEIPIGTIQAKTRSKVTIHVGKIGKHIGVRLTGSISTAQVELYGINLITYKPGD